MKNIDTLPKDISNLFHKGQNLKLNEQNLDKFLSNLKALIKERLEENKSVEGLPENLRMSKIGTPNRKLWFEFNIPAAANDRQGDNGLKFLYGDIIEQLVLFLAREAGHDVSEEQEEVILDGVVGHTDCVIDDYVIDIKSTSSFAFKKFMDGTLYRDDPFGYIAQLSAYMEAKKNTKGAFLAVNKESGFIALLKLDRIDAIDPLHRIKECKEVVKLKEPPIEKCYPPEPHNKSGNMALSKNCGYCAYKKLCWQDANGGMGLRRFLYKSGPIDLVYIEEMPSVEEDLYGGKIQNQQLGETKTT